MESRPAVDAPRNDTLSSGPELSAREADQQRVTELLSDALDLPETERQEFLDRACSGRPELRREVESLLKEAAGPGDFMDSPAVLEVMRAGGRPTFGVTLGSLTGPAPLTGLDALPVTQELGDDYRVLSVLGAGGMGTVYLAEQTAPVRRRVAVKVINASTYIARGRRRFKAECQALAYLSHPNIASLYEVGETPQGDPFLVMELVNGTAINEWCDTFQLSIEERIDLFLGACAGVRHAHEKGILHRDLKPSNILVTQVDGRPVAKVIDFGIASPRPGTSQHEATISRIIEGSPVYMSPEAAALDGARPDLDTRSDVYSLGLVLYELLGGVLPFDLEGHNVFSLLRRISEEPIPAPSQRLLDASSETADVLAQNRALTRGRSLERRLRGDLDAILLRALAHSKEERYGSPADLIRDLKRHLDHEPVEARPASSWYLLQRFVTRRLGAVVSVALLIGALSIGLVGRSVEARRANQEAARADAEARRAQAALAEAEEVSRFLTDLFDLADPDRSDSDVVTVRQLLDRGATRLQERELEDQPLARARLAQTMGLIYTKLALFEQAEELVEDALQLRRAALPENHTDVVDAMGQLGVIYRRQARYEESEKLLERTLEARLADPEMDPEKLAIAYNNLGNLRYNQGRNGEAEEAHRKALQIRTRIFGEEHEDTAISTNNLGAALQGQQRLPEALEHYETALALFIQHLGANNTRVGASYFNLCQVLQSLGQWDKAETRCQRAIDIWQHHYGPEHVRTLNARIYHSRLLIRRYRWQQAETRLRRILEDVRLANASDPHNLVRTLLYLSESLEGQGREAEADETFAEALAIRKEVHGPVNAYVAQVLARQGRVMSEHREMTPATCARMAAIYDEALEIYRQTEGETHGDTLWTLGRLAQLELLCGRPQAAETALRRHLQRLQSIEGISVNQRIATLYRLGLALEAQGRYDEAVALLRQSLEQRLVHSGPHSIVVANYRHKLGRALLAIGDVDAARHELELSLEARKEAFGDDSPAVQAVRRLLNGT